MSSENEIPTENLAYARCNSCGIELIRHKGLEPTCRENENLRIENARLKRKIKELLG